MDQPPGAATHPTTHPGLAGRDDPIVPQVNGHLMARLLPHATVHVFDDGHLGLLTAADELGPLVSTFLRRVTQSR